MKYYDLVVIGAGPAGLSAAIEGSRQGMRTIVFDENARPGGQLFKQIHKFFGSKEHQAKVRGIEIGKKLLKEAEEAGVCVKLNATVTGIFRNNVVGVFTDGEIQTVYANNIVVATGASERTLPFEGWTLPGVIGAGAAQTMMNLHGVKPGQRILMVGSGNVGLVVSYQLLQAGCEVVAVVDASPKISGYGVHAAKIARMGVPFYLSHTIEKAVGDGCVEGVDVVEVDAKWNPVEGSQKHFDVDVICVAVGLNPMSQLVRMAGAEMKEAGGLVPVVDEYGETTIPGLFAAGDVAGIEEASSAMINGRIAGVAAAYRAGYIDTDKFQTVVDTCRHSLSELRQGMFAVSNRGKDIKTTEEGCRISENLLKKGYLEEMELAQYPGVTHCHGVHPVIECTQNIPCNPCQDACKFGCISIGDQITALPIVNPEADCKNCGMCVASCSGQAIFLIDEDYDETSGTVTMPYELLPYPEVGSAGDGLNRSGQKVCKAEVVSVKTSPAFDKTALLTIKVPKEYLDQVRFFACE
ncbi:MAG: FAD-dependent oxidoreductase [Lachnospiraceae bacterium]|nr:FAD-dependent oxidoreductase [Lachnospiraceae bacterium]HCJ09182.1 pyridine nucleotide-disulfide oxidoreductase [Lachnospiraceae bacterium]